MGERNADILDDRRIVYRMGINIGDIIVEGDDIYGDGVNVAARLEGLCEPGGICLSRNVFNQVKGKLDLTFEHLGREGGQEHRRTGVGLPDRPRRQGGSLGHSHYRHATNDGPRSLASDCSWVGSEPSRCPWPCLVATLGARN